MTRVVWSWRCGRSLFAEDGRPHRLLRANVKLAPVMRKDPPGPVAHRAAARRLRAVLAGSRHARHPVLSGAAALERPLRRDVRGRHLARRGREPRRAPVPCARGAHRRAGRRRPQGLRAQAAVRRWPRIHGAHRRAPEGCARCARWSSKTKRRCARACATSWRSRASPSTSPRTAKKACSPAPNTRSTSP